MRAREGGVIFSTAFGENPAASRPNYCPTRQLSRLPLVVAGAEPALEGQGAGSAYHRALSCRAEGTWVHTKQGRTPRP